MPYRRRKADPQPTVEYQNLSVQVPVALKRQMRQFAIEHHIKISDVVRIAVIKYMEANQ